MRNFLRARGARGGEEGRYFARILRRNLIITLIVMVLLLFLAVVFSRSIIEQKKQNARLSVHQMVNTISDELDQIFSVSAAVSASDTVKIIRDKAVIDPPSDYYQLKTAQEYITATFSVYPCVEEAFFVMRKSGVILGKSGVYLDGESLFRICDFDYVAIRARATRHVSLSAYALLPCERITWNRFSVALIQEEARTAFCYYIPVSGENGMDLYVLIKDAYVRGMIADVYGASGQIRLSTLNGVCLRQYGADDVRGDAYVYHNGAGTFTIEARVSSAALLALAKGPLLLVVSYVLAALGMAVFIAYRATLTQFVPVGTVLREMKALGVAVPPKRDETAMMTASIRALSTASRTTRGELTILRSSLKRNALMFLLNGAKGISKEWLVDFPERYVVVYGCARREFREEEPGSPLIGALTLERLIQALPGNMMLHMLNANAFAFIYPVTDGREGEPARVLNDLVSQINAEFRDPLSVSLSRPVSGSENAYAALEEARMRMLLSNVPEGLVELPDETGQKSARFQNGVALYQALTSENSENARARIDRIVRMNFMAQSDMRGLYEYVANIVRFAAADANCADVSLAPYRVNLSPNEILERFYAAADAICGRREEEKRRFSDKQRKAILVYIEENISAYDFCLRDVCERFQLTERAAQTAVHSETGMSLSAYLLKIRLSRAAAMLTGGAQPVYAICEQVGFNTLSTFQKAFKRAYGVAPGEWRKNGGAR